MVSWNFVSIGLVLLIAASVILYFIYKAWKHRKDISSTLIKSTVFAKRYIRRRKYIEKLEQKQEQLQVTTNEDELEAKRKEQRKKRSFVFKEILDTERKYVTDLLVLQDYYMEPIKKIAFSSNSNSQIFKRETYELMFQNLETIIGVNKVFLKELESIEETGIAPMVSAPKVRSNTIATVSPVTSESAARAKRPKRHSLLVLKDLLNITKKNKPKISPPPVPKKPAEFSNNIKSELQAEATSSKEEELAKLLAYFSHSFKLYTDYISNFKNAALFLEEEKKNPEFIKSIKELKSKIPYAQKPTLDSLLITPIQRLCRYRLLLEELVKNCSTEEHLHKKVLKAVDAMKSVASYVNEKERENENIFKMVSLQNRLGTNYTILTPSSKLVKDLEFFLDEEEADAANKPVACLCSFGNPPTEVPVDTLFIFTDSIVIELAQLDSSEVVQEEIVYVVPYNILVSIKKTQKDTIEISYKRNHNVQQITLSFQLAQSNNTNQLYEVMGKVLNLVTQYKELSTD